MVFLLNEEMLLLWCGKWLMMIMMMMIFDDEHICIWWWIHVCKVTMLMMMKFCMNICIDESYAQAFMSLGVRLFWYPVTSFRIFRYPVTHGSIGNKPPTFKTVPDACIVVPRTLHSLSPCQISHTWLCEWCELCEIISYLVMWITWNMWILRIMWIYVEMCTWMCCSLMMLVHLWWLWWIENDVKSSWCLIDYENSCMSCDVEVWIVH